MCISLPIVLTLDITRLELDKECWICERFSEPLGVVDGYAGADPGLF